MVQLKSLHEPPRYLLGLSTSEPSGTFISRFSGWISMLGRCHMVRMRHPWQMVMAMAHGSSSHIVSKSWTSISSHGLSSFSQHFFSKLNSHFWGTHISLYIYNYETKSRQIHVDFWDVQLGGAASVVLAIYLAGLPQHLGRSRWHLGPPGSKKVPHSTARTKVLQQMAQLSIRARGGAWGLGRLGIPGPGTGSSRMLQVGTQFQHRFPPGQGGDLCGEILPASLAQLPTEKHRSLAPTGRSWCWRSHLRFTSLRPSIIKISAYPT